MIRALLAIVLSALCLALPATSETIRLSYIYSDGNTPGTLKAYEHLLREHPELQSKIELQIMSESSVKSIDPQAFIQSDVLVFDMMNEQMVEEFGAEHEIDVIRDIVANGTVLAVGVGLRGEEAYEEMGATFNNRAQAYWQNSGPSNQLGLMKYALQLAGVEGLTLPDPQPSLDFGFYYPTESGGEMFSSWDALQEWKRANGKLKPDAPRVALSFFSSTIYGGDTDFANAVIAEIERQGAEAVPIFGYPGAVAARNLLMDEDGRPRADVLLASNFNFADTDASGHMVELGIPVINMISLYGRNEEEWRASDTGLSIMEGTFNLVTPEFVGTIAPTVTASKETSRDPLTGLPVVTTYPIPDQVDLVVRRALKYANLRRTPNADKKLVLIYYNYPPGIANIGASYLNVPESISRILNELHAAGYDIGGEPPDVETVISQVTEEARNVLSAAPGDLEVMLSKGNAVRIPISQYESWLNDLAPAFRDKVYSDWGEPEDGKLMTYGEGNERSVIVPVVRYGNVILTPQAVRGWGEDLAKMYHAKDLAPHHQYVASYEWMKRDFGSDAVLHIGTHGTLEWLDGRDAGLGPDDAPDALIGDLPNIYIYNVDVVGEGLVARRRSAAMLVDHMVPPFKKSRLTEELAELSELVSDYTENLTKNPELALQYAKQIREMSADMGITKDLGLPVDEAWTTEQHTEVEDYLLQLREQNIPYGLHAFGRTPIGEEVATTVDAVVSADRSAMPVDREIMADEMTDKILASGPRELANLLLAFEGGFIPAGHGGEPIRNPDAYPTGKNFYGIDPDKVPKPAAWDMGVKLADQMIADHLEEHGEYPKKISFVIWGDETLRHEGVLESQILYLLGTKPVWDARGKVVDVEVIPRAELGRPRVDIVIGSASPGLFSNITILMAEAVEKVKVLEEADNIVRKNYLATRRALVEMGQPADLADRMASVRIFDEPPGTYNLNTATIVENSGSWDDEVGFANDYINKMGHAYGAGFWGEPMPDVFRMNLSGVQKVVHSNSTTVYGAIDNDDMYMYVGGLASAVRSVDGETPDVMITNTRDPGKPEMTTLNKFVGQEFKTRYVNPVWMEGMMREGYSGAGAMRKFVEFMWGWDATVTEAVDDQMWQETFEVYVEDKHDMQIKEWFGEESPFAYQDITARMLETVRKEYWDADDATTKRLVEEFLENVNTYGAGCSGVTCDNPRLLEYIMDEAVRLDVDAERIEAAQAKFETLMQVPIALASAELREFAEQNDALGRSLQGQAESRIAAAGYGSARQSDMNEAPSTEIASAEGGAPKQQGYVMEEEDRSIQPQMEQDREYRAMTFVDYAWPPVVLIMGLLAFGFMGPRAGRA